MATVYVREQGATIRKNGEQLRVTQQQRELFTIPLANLEQLILLGNVQITTPAAALLMRTGVDVVFMSTYGTYQGRMIRLGSKFAQLRHLQLRLCDDARRAMEIAAQIVEGKINNQRVVLQRRTDPDERIRSALSGMADMLRQASGARDLDQLRGFEGRAAAWYFEGMRAFFHPDWGFETREYHPPPDPANALLSFAYTLLRKDIEAKIQLVGLDPYLGFFHALGYDRPALALDLMEEFRPSIADIVVLSLVMGGHITLDDFERTNNPDLPVRLTPPAIEVLVTAYENRLADRVHHPLANSQTDYRRAIELQVRQMARIVQGREHHYHTLELR
jgi:CRISPR-associated protein Cas1